MDILKMSKNEICQQRIYKNPDCYWDAAKQFFKKIFSLHIFFGHFYFTRFLSSIFGIHFTTKNGRFFIIILLLKLVPKNIKYVHYCYDI